MTNDEVTAEMEFAVKFLEQISESSPEAKRANEGIKFMSMALDGLSNMMRMLPEATQQQIAKDMYAVVQQNRETAH